ncbi:MAG: sugar transferase [Clostridia bacterium]|nr:sugar transferase [Clostridia bacterium]
MDIHESNQPTVDQPETVILPYEADKEYTVEPLGELEKKPVYDFSKRLFDVVVSLFFMILLAIPMLVIAALVWCTSKGPALYCQERLGLNGKPFNVIKFRTMVYDAEKSGARWSQGDEDTRITKVGSLLRKTRLDELPQLWCIFFGTMSFVGPRPERKVFYDQFENYIHGFRQRLMVMPGLTGWAQINGGYNLRPEEKIVYDVEYIKTRSLWLDIKIMFKTIAIVFNHEGAK